MFNALLFIIQFIMTEDVDKVLTLSTYQAHAFLYTHDYREKERGGGKGMQVWVGGGVGGEAREAEILTPNQINVTRYGRRFGG